MFAYWRGLIKGLSAAFVLLASLAVIGCGGDSDPEPVAGGEATAESSDQGADPGPSAGDPDTEGADTEDVRVITEWAEALSAGDIDAAAALFELPSVAENGLTVVRIRTTEDALAFNASLPCGAELTAAETAGEFTTATFRLLDRPGGGCGPGTGGSAMTSFVVEGGKIVEWRRVGTDPGGPGGVDGNTT